MGRHANAPLTPAGRRRLVQRIADGRPIAHVAAEAGLSRSCVAKWYARWLEHGDAGLIDHSSRPERSPTATSSDIVQMVLDLRRDKKWGPARISAFLGRNGVTVAPATVHRILRRNQISRVRDMDRPSGELMRGIERYEHERAGDMVHVDVKKVGRIPQGGGWRIHGKGSDGHRASQRKGPGTGKVGYTYLHSAVDDYSRLAYTEALPDEKGETAAEFWIRSVQFFAQYGVGPIHRVLTDNGSCYRSRAWAEALRATGTTHKRTQPYTPRTNGKVERFNGTLSREWAYVRAYESEAQRTAALADFLNHYNHERLHAGIGNIPPVERVPGREFRLVPQIAHGLNQDADQVEGQLSIWDFVQPTS